MEVLYVRHSYPDNEGRVLLVKLNYLFWQAPQLVKALAPMAVTSL